MGHDKLANHFKTNFSLMQHHKWQLNETENMMPWERYVYIDLLHEFLKEQEQQAKQREQDQKHMLSQLRRR